ncbi:MAG: copper binding protein CutA [Candidatus Westeberhardia cardiocondylae]|nr:copper binding protein CutA [Candidatus Westeberhardia cardiocondylae]
MLKNIIKKILKKIQTKKKNNNLCIVLCTSPNKECTKKIIKSILNNKLSACITTIPHVVSTYYWKNTIKKSIEEQLIIKTTTTLTTLVISNIKKNHTYSIPEILTIPIIKGNTQYISWIHANTLHNTKNS